MVRLFVCWACQKLKKWKTRYLWMCLSNIINCLISHAGASPFPEPSPKMRYYFVKQTESIHISINFLLLFFFCHFIFGIDMHLMGMMIYFGSVVSMGGCSLALTMVLYLTEALYFRSSTLTFYVIFPCVLNCK